MIQFPDIPFPDFERPLLNWRSEKTMYKAENIVAFASNSGKSTCKLTVKRFEEIFLLTAENESTLCLDSWTGQKEKKFY